MNKLEKFVYDLVKSNPKLKDEIRNIYQSFFDFLPRKSDYFKGDIVIKEGYFYGFHDLDPISSNGKYILSNKLTIPLRMPKANDKLVVGYWDSKLETYTIIGETTAWNYHKGCRLQWLGESNNKLIYNCVVDGVLGCCIYSIKDNSNQYYTSPIDSVDHNGIYATSFSYQRLNVYMPGYGYLINDEAYMHEDNSANTGLFILDLKNNVKKLIVSLEKLSRFKSEASMIGAHHYVTHTQFSPDGTRVAFLHRWTFDDPNKRFTRLITCKIDGTELFSSKTSGMVSHFDWDEDNGILAYCQVDGVDGHYLFKNYKMDDPKRVITKLNSDGHQSYIPKTSCFITDTYPDKYRMAKLYFCNIKTNECTLIASLKSPKKFQSPSLYKHWACDLHPRVCSCGDIVCFDSVHTGNRSLCIMKLNR